MAENKKSFVLYCDYKAVFDMLTDAQTAELIRTIFNYVNDLHPEPKDPIISVAFEPIKQQLKRDLKKWESTIEGKRKGGLKSGESRRKKKVKVSSTKLKSVEDSATERTVNVNVNDIHKIRMPFLSNEFLDAWKDWKDYRKSEHNFKYKSDKTEQAAITELDNLCKGNEDLAIRIIRKSISSGWKGFFMPKENNINGHSYSEPSSYI